MPRTRSRTAKIRRMIEEGHDTKTIVAKLRCKPQHVYNVRYKIKVKEGLGSLAPSTPMPNEGIGTGIASAPPIAEVPPTFRFDPAPVKAEGAPIPKAIIEIEPPKSTLWQRIKGWFK